MTSEEKINLLIKKGVTIHAPASVYIDAAVNPDRISAERVVIHPGSRILGKETFICSGAEIGREAPATVENCRVGPDVKLKGGYFTEAIFLEKASAGSGSHVRGGTIFEEEANIAHTVGLKQTILFPFVTLGSLINFCDCLMAGGTSRKDHSEVGSSYIHFNYTPNQDKATASLIGDVPHGVMMNKKPIFLGGQGGLVGPCVLTYGTVIAAGTLQRTDEMKEDRLLYGGGLKRGSMPAPSGVYSSVKRIVRLNINYIGNLLALRRWYLDVRSGFISERFPEPLFDGLVQTLDVAIDERVKRLKALTEKFKVSLDLLEKEGAGSQSLIRQKKEFIAKWPEIETIITDVRNGKVAGTEERRTMFLNGLDEWRSVNDEKSYVDVIKGLDRLTVEAGVSWLGSIVDMVNNRFFEIMPEFN